MKSPGQIRFNKIYARLKEDDRSEFVDFLICFHDHKSGIPKKVIEDLKTDSDFDRYLRENYASRTRWNIYSELVRHLQEYLAIKEMQSEPKLKKILFGKQLVKLGMTETVNTIFDEELKKIKAGPLDRKFYDFAGEVSGLMMSELLKKKCFMSLNEINKINSDLKLIYGIYDILDALILHENFRNNYLSPPPPLVVKSLKYIDLEKVVETVRREYKPYYITLNMSLKLYELTRSDAVYDDFRKIYAYFENNRSSFSKPFTVVIYTLLINSLIQLRNSGQKRTDHMLFKVIKSKVENGFVDDLIHDMPGGNHFRDYVSIALSVDEIEWAKKFTENLGELLPDNLLQNDHQIAKAMICFKEGRYSEASGLAKNIQLKNFLHLVDSYRIRILSEFEMNNIENCWSLLHNLKRRLTNYKDMPDDFRAAYGRFIQAMKKILNYQSTGRSRHLEDLRILVNKPGILPAASWFRKKIL